jgi:alpha-beta hydrolase superfamily lysophospholipase
MLRRLLFLVIWRMTNNCYHEYRVILSIGGIMNQQTYLLSKDSLNLFVRGWQAAGTAKGVVCLVHGLGDHGGQYVDLAEALGAAGYATIAMDTRGNGRSGGQRGHIPSIEVALDDISLLLEEAHHRHPEMPCFLYGHSMGGNLVLNYVLRRKPQLAGVIATSPWLKTAFEPPVHLAILARIMSVVWPTLSSSSSLDTSNLYHEDEGAEPKEHDPLLHGRVSARLFMELTRAGDWALQHASEFMLPLLVMHGNEDGITSPTASEKFARSVTSNCTFRLWDGFYHELHHETERQKVFEYIIEWLTARTGVE